MRRILHINRPARNRKYPLKAALSFLLIFQIQNLDAELMSLQELPTLSFSVCTEPGGHHCCIAKNAWQEKFQTDFQNK